MTPVHEHLISGGSWLKMQIKGLIGNEKSSGQGERVLI